MLYTVNFENATADFDIGREDPLIVWADGKSEPISVEGTDGYEGELAYFVDCVRKGKTPSLVTAEDAVVSIEIVEAEARSVETGEAVKL
jgi:predicted dehydrogenase